MQLNTPDLHPSLQLALAQTHLGKLASAMRKANVHEQVLQQVVDRHEEIFMYRTHDVVTEAMLENAREWSTWWTSSKYAPKQ